MAHINCLSLTAQKTLAVISSLINSRRFILGGGTALALRLGHRISVDLDFFTNAEFATDNLFRELTELGFDPKVLQEEKGTLTVIIDDTKISFFHYPYPFFNDTLEFAKIKIAGTIDIASMKVIAISQRGAKRDFVDLHFILQDTPFWKVAENMMKRFGTNRINPLHVGKSLVYFDDAEADPEPRYMIKNPPKWIDIKKFFKRNVQQMVIDLQKAKF